MARPKSNPQDPATLEKIVAAAEEEFGQKGFDGARLEDIAKKSGIRRPSLLYHFPSKEILYKTVVQRAFGTFGERLEAAMSAVDLPLKIDAAIAALQVFLQEHPALGKVILREWIDGDGPGQDLLLTSIAPLIERVEQAMLPIIQPEFPIRESILLLALSSLARTAGNPALKELLWGKDDHTQKIAHHLFFGGSDGSPSNGQKRNR